MESPTLYLVCGKIAAGKTTLCQTLAAAPRTILISQDVWLSRLYPGEISSLQDYARCSSRLREVIGPHVVSLLGAGVSVVLDFPANTVSTRRWMRGLFDAAHAQHQLHFLDVPAQLCKERLSARNASGAHDYSTSEEDFELFSSYFVPPADAEGFRVIVHQR